MSERFGIPDHSPQHAPDHSLHNPTPSGSFGSSSDWYPPASNSGSYTGGSSTGISGGYTGPYVRSKRSVIVAIVLAALFGPLGLFYVNFLNGIAALAILPPVVRTLIYAIALQVGGGTDTIDTLLFPVIWCFTIPWAIIGVKIRNRRIDRAASSEKQP